MTNRNKNRYVVDGVIAWLETNKGQRILIDSGSIEKIRDFTWCVSGNGYPMSRTGNRVTILHRLLVGTGPSDYVDHINGNPLDNRLANLRICAKQQNEFNQKIRVDNTTGYRGVCPGKNGKFRAYIVKNGRQYRLGLFDNPVDAAKAYDLKAKELFGEYARLNLLED